MVHLQIVHGTSGTIALLRNSASFLYDGIFSIKIKTKYEVHFFLLLVSIRAHHGAPAVQTGGASSGGGYLRKQPQPERGPLPADLQISLPMSLKAPIVPE
jgi:hypothetical protein